jgi:predicted house-cleaning noncanonical NTP pyrophosphatase (MazG superfamily)
MPVYNKIVRDRIPEIIERDGADEFILKPSKEELADLAEVLYAIAEKHGWNWPEIEKVREEKKLKRVIDRHVPVDILTGTYMDTTQPALSLSEDSICRAPADQIVRYFSIPLTNEAAFSISSSTSSSLTGSEAW